MRSAAALAILALGAALAIQASAIALPLAGLAAVVMWGARGGQAKRLGICEDGE